MKWQNWPGKGTWISKEEIPYKLIPGPQAQFRCCIYREREIIRQRVRLAEGLCPTSGKDTRNIVQVIGAACEGCPDPEEADVATSAHEEPMEIPVADAGADEPEDEEEKETKE